MKTLLGAIALLPLLAAPAIGDQATAPTLQTSRMAACSSQAGERRLSGDARQQFMAECLKGRAPSSPPGAETSGTQGEAMKRCNNDASARGLKGDERKAFMRQCLRAGSGS
jgi:psiF repeat